MESKVKTWTSLVAQRLRLPFNAGGVGPIPGQGTKIPHASKPKTQNIKQKQYCNRVNKDFKNGPHQYIYIYIYMQWWDRHIIVIDIPIPEGIKWNRCRKEFLVLMGFRIWPGRTPFPGGSDDKCGRPGLGRLIPGWGRSSGGGHGNPLQYSCLENPMDRGPWRPTVHGVAKGWTRLSD